MNKISHLHLHPYEWLFGSFLSVTTVRLLVSGSWGMSAGFMLMAVAIILAALATTRWPTRALVRARLALIPVLVNVVYCELGAVMRHFPSGNWDAALLRIDRALLGETPAVSWNPAIHPAVTEVLSGCYLLFFPAVLVAFAAAILRPKPYGVRLFNGLIGIYALGFFGYTLVPAMGPHLAMPDAFDVPLTGGFLTRINATLVQKGSNHVDVFPSLHTAITVFLMGWLWRHHRRIFPVFLLPAVGLCAATLYLRYHYAVDVAAGILLAGIGLRMARNPDMSHELHASL